jgi:hypothetical protein
MNNLVEQLNNEPIILTTFFDHAEERSIVDAYLKSVDLALTIPGPVYRIIDVQQAVSSYPVVVNTIRDAVKLIANAAIHPEMAVAFVGTAEMVQSFAETGVIFFDSMDDALTHARSQVAEGVAG